MPDRLLDHYTDTIAAERGKDPEVVRAQLDTNPFWESRLGRSGGPHERLRALVTAGIATDEERNAFNKHS